MERYHRGETGRSAGKGGRGIRREESHMGGEELIASHPASITIVV